MDKKYAKDGLKVLSIHTPEFDFEKERGRVERAVKRYKVKGPLYMDNDYAYWKSLHNRYWPAFYLVDRNGYIRSIAVGEVHEGTAKGEMLEAVLQSLLEEKASASG
jgi:hypothetical protein